MEDHKTQILLEAGRGRYAIAEFDEQNSELMPTESSIDIRTVLPYGITKRYIYSHHPQEDGLFKKGVAMAEVKKRCFDEMLDNLEKLVSEHAADAVLVDVVSNSESKTSWILAIDTQLILYRQNL